MTPSNIMSSSSAIFYVASSSTLNVQNFRDMIFKHVMDTGMKMFDFDDSKIKSNDTTDNKDTDEEFTLVKSKKRKRKLHHESADKKAPTCK